MWLNEQRIQALLNAYCALAQAESEDMSRNIKWGIKRGFEKGPRVMPNLCALDISMEIKESLSLMNLTLKLFGKCLR